MHEEARHSTRAFAPASVANLTVGFDVLGVAIEPLGEPAWGDVVGVAAGAPGDPPLALTVAGPFASALDGSGENVVVTVARALLVEATRAGIEPGPLRLHLEKGLPVGSGLGSSAASSVAALVALERHLGLELEEEKRIALAARGEETACGAAHVDNVAPSLLGGLLLLGPRGSVVRLPWPEDLFMVVARPDHSISTRTAREVLPREVPLPVAVEQGRRLAALVSALHRGETGALAACLEDGLAEPARTRLLPGFSAVKEAVLGRGALGFGLAGSGASVFALAPSEEIARALLPVLVDGFSRAGIPATAHRVRVDRRGARVLEGDSR
jgi:homoserine kinase